MIKYVDTLVGFREIPDEISLCINISNCPNECDGCHSSYLKEDVGTPLTYVELVKLMSSNKGITCVCFMGGDKEPWEIERLAQRVIEYGLKTAWYSGKQELPKTVNPEYFHYIKLGPYIKERGPLDNPNTNQRLYKTEFTDARVTGKTELQMIDITYKFWKQHDIEN